LNATKNASVFEEAPKILANIISLANPEIREIKVILPTIYEDFNIELVLFLFIGFTILHLYVDSNHLH